MRWGDWIVVVSMGLNFLACAGYAWQGHGWNAFYFLCAFGLNLSILQGMR